MYTTMRVCVCVKYLHMLIREYVYILCTKIIITIIKIIIFPNNTIFHYFDFTIL